MKYLRIIIFLMISNLAAAQFVGTPYIVKKVPIVKLISVVPVYATTSTPTDFSCVLTGSVINYGSSPLVEYGFYYGKDLLSNATKVISNNFTSGTFSVTITSTGNSNLMYDSSYPKYYVQAYAKNTSGIDYDSSSSLTFQNVPTMKFGGFTWIDRNLGASSYAVSTTDINSYGFYYQWGRGNDGHQIINSDAINGPSGTSYPATPYFYKSSSNWGPQNTNLWTASSSNNPCPSGFRVPNQGEMSTLTASAATSADILFTNASSRVPLTGYRSGSNGIYYDKNSNGYYWTAITETTQNWSAAFYIVSSWRAQWFIRATGMPVRCILN